MNGRQQTVPSFVHKGCSRITSSPKSLFERSVDYKVYALPVQGYIGSLAAPDQATLTEESRALQRLGAGPYNANVPNVDVRQRTRSGNQRLRNQSTWSAQRQGSGSPRIQATSTEWDRCAPWRCRHYQPTL